MTDRQTELPALLTTLDLRVSALGPDVAAQSASWSDAELQYDFSSSLSAHQKVGLKPAWDALGDYLLAIPGLRAQSWDLRTWREKGQSRFGMTVNGRSVLRAAPRDLAGTALSLCALAERLDAVAPGQNGCDWAQYRIDLNAASTTIVAATTPRHASWIYAALGVCSKDDLSNWADLRNRITQVTEIHAPETWR